MVSLLAQAAQQTSPLDIGAYTQTLFKSLIGVDVIVAFKMLFAWLFIIWLIFAVWVAVDAANRYKQWPIAVFWFIFVLPFNVLGFIGYLFMRPVVTLEEKQWTRLESKYLMYELSSVNDCPNCRTLVPVGHNFCAVCGTQMNVNCPKCNELQSIYNGFCSNCGEKLTPEEKKDVAVAEASVTKSTDEAAVTVSPTKLAVGDRILAILSQAGQSISASAKSVVNAIAPKKKVVAPKEEVKVEAKAGNKGKKESSQAKAT